MPENIKPCVTERFNTLYTNYLECQHLLTSKIHKSAQKNNYELKLVYYQYAMGRIGFSPFYRVLKESLHFWERRDNSDIQSFYLVFSIWILPESGREERKINKFLFILIIISHLSNTCQEKSKQQSVLSQDFSELIVFFTSYCDTPQCRRSIVMFVI